MASAARAPTPRDTAAEASARAYFRRVPPSATLIGPALPPTPDKWLGGEQAVDGFIYGVPGSAKDIVKVDPRTGSVTVVGEAAISGAACSQPRGKYKWLRGALSPETGAIFCVPSNADRVLRIDAQGNAGTARRSSVEHLIATKALRCTAMAWILTVAQCSAIP